MDIDHSQRTFFTSNDNLGVRMVGNFYHVLWALEG